MPFHFGHGASHALIFVLHSNTKMYQPVPWTSFFLICFDLCQCVGLAGQLWWSRSREGIQLGIELSNQEQWEGWHGLHSHKNLCFTGQVQKGERRRRTVSSLRRRHFLRPFEQAGPENTMVRLSLENITMPLDDGVYLVLQVRLSGKLRFKCMTLSKKEIPIQVYCDHVMIPFSYNNATAAKVGFKVHQCKFSGFIWDLIELFPIFPLVIVIAFLLTFSCEFCEQNLQCSAS